MIGVDKPIKGVIVRLIGLLQEEINDNFNSRGILGKHSFYGVFCVRVEV